MTKTCRLLKLGLRQRLGLEDDAVTEIDHDLAVLKHVSTLPVIAIDCFGSFAHDRNLLAQVSSASLGPRREQGEPADRRHVNS